MKTIIRTCSLICMLMPLIGLAIAEKSEVVKRITKDFNVQADHILDISNKYGRIDIAIGASNHIKMEVTMKVEAGNERKAQEALDRISVSITQSGNRVSATTNISSTTGWSSWFDSGNVEMEINYHVFVPEDIYLELRQKYGSIFVETTRRDLRIDLDYGDLNLGDIHARVSLQMSYSNATMSMIRSGDIHLSYSDLEMEDAPTLKLEMKYSNVVMGSAVSANVVASYSDFKGMDIDDFTYRGKYDGVNVERVKTVDMESSYSGWRIGGLSGQGRFDMRYGDLQINNIGGTFSKLDINTSYTGVVLRFAPSTSFTIDAETNYCGIDHRGLKVSENIQKASNTILKASKGSGGGLVRVRMNYGELKLE